MSKSSSEATPTSAQTSPKPADSNPPVTAKDKAAAEKTAANLAAPDAAKSKKKRAKAPKPVVVAASVELTTQAGKQEAEITVYGTDPLVTAIDADSDWLEDGDQINFAGNTLTVYGEASMLHGANGSRCFTFRTVTFATVSYSGPAEIVRMA